MTVLLGAIGFALALGRYDVGAYLWLELLFVLGTLVLAVLFFSRSVRPLLSRSAPLLARLKLDRPLRAFYEGVHAFRSHGRLLANVFTLTLTLQAIRVLSIWAAAKAVGIDLSPLVYYVMGPLFFLVLLVPFTLNGFAVREAFFVSFLGVGGRRGRRVRSRLPLLPRHGRDGPAGRSDPALGGAARRRPTATHA